MGVQGYDLHPYDQGSGHSGNDQMEFVESNSLVGSGLDSNQTLMSLAFGLS